MALFEPLFAALNTAGVRYVVVGGFATLLHGYARLTADVDLAVDLSPAEARKAIGTLLQLGLRSRVPVDPLTFSDPATRAEWAREKSMRVLSLWDPQNPMREVDVFIENPIEFSLLWERSVVMPLASTEVRVASIDDLIAMKRRAGRPQDVTDVEALEAIKRLRDG